MRKIEDLEKPRDESEHGTLDSEKTEEEIIFPLQEPGASPVPQKGGHVFLKIFGAVAAPALAFLLGFATNPESLDKTVKIAKEYAAVVWGKLQPARQKVAREIDAALKDMKPAAPGPHPTAPVPEQEKKQRKIKYWWDPMAPDYKSSKPGKSPMGMDMVPVYEKEPEVREQPDREGIRIDPAMTQNIGVKTAKAVERTLAREIRTVGRLTYDERTVSLVHTKYEGWIEKLYVNFTGQEVKQDDMLVDIYSPDLVSTQEEFLLALKYSQTMKDGPFLDIGQGADSLLEATRRRLEWFDVPEHQIEDLVHNKKITKTLHIHAHSRGFVIQKNALEGMFAKPDMTLYTIVDLSNIWVLADIYEYELPWVKMGQETEMTLSYFPGRKFKGKVSYIDPFLDPKSRTVKVRMEFDNPNWELKPDMYANVALKSAVAKKALAVPEEAVIHSGEKDIVVVRNKSGGFESREVELGPQAEGYFQIIRGIRPGDEVVTSASFLIDSESRLREAAGKMPGMKSGATGEKAGPG
ncbi:MAG: efflux RND transporter periplasmic adaptor subunit [Nitrospinae bacterium]|nr:efflux RND transporter periplasmic adaptor subunit [Nitrospinota bacterium]